MIAGELRKEMSMGEGASDGLLVADALLEGELVPSWGQGSLNSAFDSAWAAV
jgi:hypothetical protein